MPQSKILIDSNAYFRLAYNLHPLLSSPFGQEEFTLYVIDNFQNEFDNNPRLRRKFFWVDQEPYLENRQRKISMSRQARKDIDLAFDFIWEHNISLGLGASPTDVRAIAYGYILQIPVVTDDKNMVELGKAFGVRMLRLIDILDLMYRCGHIDESKIDSVVQHLVYDNDLPYPGFAKECKKRWGLAGTKPNKASLRI